MDYLAVWIVLYAVIIISAEGFQAWELRQMLHQNELCKNNG